MAKSTHSKIKRKFRAIKRTAVFAPVESERLKRLAQKQAEAALKSPAHIDANTTMETEAAEPEQDERVGRRSNREQESSESMQTDGQAKSLGQTSKLEKERLFMNKNQFKRKMKAKAISKAGRKSGKITKRK
ncbi:uncharacterized protein BJ171DRAFT_473931 [Polychytrium aggregatum]|uniref:uncharacterized protein n=1 Tax=Polychytrium aggregatum TaxID=110093 RepID=UPI0022FE90C9|nr:uncharacterized protein BJ171DRAFT_473931 [Polychytrium aggregatum]KAI9205920.1 hypothetical protein BJ171DRAFT_473931 [Polychytrium aggregatum]